MSPKYHPSISLEKFSAFLDGNLPDAEMSKLSEEISNSDYLSSMLENNLEAEDLELSMASEEFDELVIDENTFQLPEIEISTGLDENNFTLGDIWIDSESSINIENDLKDEPSNNNIEDFSLSSTQQDDYVESNPQAMKEYVNYGYEPNRSGSTFDPETYQGPQPSCSINSQGIIMRDYGIQIPNEELIAYATSNGWYNPDPEKGGTPRTAVGNLLDAVGIENQRFEHANINDIISELRAGHRVIVSVDAKELWIKNEPSLRKRIFGEINNKLNDTVDNILDQQGANHSLIVAGVNVNPENPSDMKVVLIDTGSGDACIEYSFKDFQNAWNDSDRYMVATTEPAPYQYNYETHQLEPSGFATDFVPSTVEMPEGLDNDFKLPESYNEAFRNITPTYSEEHPIDFPDSEDESDDSRKEMNDCDSIDAQSDDDDDSNDSTSTDTDYYDSSDDDSIGNNDDAESHDDDEYEDNTDSDEDLSESDSDYDPDF